MPGKRKPDGGKHAASAGKQVNFRAPDDLFSRLEATADALGLDVSNLVRMILYENLGAYERRAEAIRATESAD